MSRHALLSASSSHRWLNCPPSARLCESYEDKGSDYAAEGTDAHSLCEFKLKTALGMEAQDPTENLSYYSEEMEDCANDYAAYVLELVEVAKKSSSDPVILIEQRLDYSRFVESGFGTGDCVIVADGTLTIVDYKHGRGILVEADNNPQSVPIRGKQNLSEVQIMSPYEELANAIVLQAVKDYRLHDDEKELASIERFFRSGWFGVLTSIDPEMLIAKLRKEKVRYEC